MSSQKQLAELARHLETLDVFIALPKPVIHDTESVWENTIKFAQALLMLKRTDLTVLPDALVAILLTDLKETVDFANWLGNLGKQAVAPTDINNRVGVCQNYIKRLIPTSGIIAFCLANRVNRSATCADDTDQLVRSIGRQLGAMLATRSRFDELIRHAPIVLARVTATACST